MPKPEKRELLMLAHPLKTEASPLGLFASEKLDGVRAFWDGGVTRGLPTREVPWAGILAPKTGKEKDKIVLKSTGLWTRYGNPIVAPDEWLDTLPPIFLDGELYLGPGRFQETVSVVSKETPERSRWDKISYCIFASPSIDQFCRTGMIGSKSAQQLTFIDYSSCTDFLRRQLSFWVPLHGDLRDAGDEYIASADHLEDWVGEPGWVYTDVKSNIKFAALSGPVPFKKELAFIKSFLRRGSKARLIQQTEIHTQEQLEEIYEAILENQGEGIILRDPSKAWEPKRGRVVQKLKPFSDAEVVVVGFTAGANDFEGMIGALRVEWAGLQFEVGSGLTIPEREILNPPSTSVKPGEPLPPDVVGRHFKPGDVVTIKYSGYTDAGVPRIASYWRKHA